MSIFKKSNRKINVQVLEINRTINVDIMISMTKVAR